MREANTLAHCFTHKPKNPYCIHCARGKVQRATIHKGTMQLGPTPANFGDQCTCDHLISRNDGGELINVEDEALMEWGGASNGLVMYDRATGYKELYPQAKRDTESCVEAFNDWCSPTEKIESLYADNAP